MVDIQNIYGIYITRKWIEGIKHRCNNQKETLVEWLIFKAFKHGIFGIYITYGIYTYKMDFKDKTMDTGENMLK